ncbi:unnamed protein product [Polarella glacialis]|uniref:Uncharacterized protein n=1 Tax=Polarella glacialis TaxID=89957 RepID=A0A813KCJ1_POLGL|nr:unnamed protein product [Polarella glacialis]CAE8695526.1 unnamed protein product [Polarella glacialis]
MDRLAATMQAAVAAAAPAVAAAAAAATTTTNTKYIGLAGTAGACSMLSLAVLSLADLELSLKGMPCVSQIALLLVAGLACLTGERSEASQQLSWQDEVVREYLGFAMRPGGRAAAYVLALLHGLGAHAEHVEAGKPIHSGLFGSLWGLCCFVLLLGAAVSLWAWRQPQQTALLLDTGGPPGPEEDTQSFSYERVYEPPFSA